MSINTLPDHAGPNQSFDSSEAFLQRLDSLLSLVSHASFQSQPDRGSYAYDGDLKTGQQRREGYLKILCWIRETSLREGHDNTKLLQKMLRTLDNLEAALQAEGLLPSREQGGAV